MPVRITYYYGIMREHQDAEPCFFVSTYERFPERPAVVDFCHSTTLRLRPGEFIPAVCAKYLDDAERRRPGITDTVYLLD